MNNESLEQQLSRALNLIRSYKAREESIVIGLGEVQKAIAVGEYTGAKAMMDELMATDLKDSKETVYNREMALDISLRALREIPAIESDGLVFPTKVREMCERAIKEIDILVPVISTAQEYQFEHPN